MRTLSEAHRHEAAEYYRRALESFGNHPQPNANEAHLGLARISYEWNDLDAAEEHGERGLQLRGSTTAPSTGSSSASSSSHG